MCAHCMTPSTSATCPDSSNALPHAADPSLQQATAAGKHNPAIGLHQARAAPSGAHAGDWGSEQRALTASVDRFPKLSGLLSGFSAKPRLADRRKPQRSKSKPRPGKGPAMYMLPSAWVSSATNVPLVGPPCIRGWGRCIVAHEDGDINHPHVLQHVGLLIGRLMPRQGSDCLPGTQRLGCCSHACLVG